MYGAFSPEVADLSRSDVDSDDELLHARSTNAKRVHTMTPEAIPEVINLADSDDDET